MCLKTQAITRNIIFIVYVAEGFDINEKIEDFDNQTPLHAACISGSLPIVHVLVQVQLSPLITLSFFLSHQQWKYDVNLILSLNHFVDGIIHSCNRQRIENSIDVCCRK